MDTFQLTEPHTPHSPHTCNHLRALTEPPSKPPLPRRRHSPSSSHPNLRSLAVIFSVTGSRGEGNIENDEDPHSATAVLPRPLSWKRSPPALSLLLTLHSTSTAAHRSGHKAQFPPSSTPLNVSSLHRCSTVVTCISQSRPSNFRSQSRFL
ncbi:hypothetical protein PIB30_096857 [Stylosanthes scabra]|uniref:Uncharacterized protein n=1 Tax=Stylosanthes scabra TaxID=79078 RepID=A0ABU6QYM8_9FABA|nr:hypothetical protein [Stylosanthes scabra]